MGKSVLTTGFSRVDGLMYCEGVSLERIALDVGTPAYVYSAATIRDRYTRLDHTLAQRPDAPTLVMMHHAPFVTGLYPGRGSNVTTMAGRPSMTSRPVMRMSSRYGSPRLM